MNDRRRVIRLALAAGATLAVPTLARAQAKGTKAAFQYQEMPKNGQKCDQCAFWIPGPKPGARGACKVVEGDINPNGWCISFAPAPKK